LVQANLWHRGHAPTARSSFRHNLALAVPFDVVHLAEDVTHRAMHKEVVATVCDLGIMHKSQPEGVTEAEEWVI
jgi:hypothetical protein